MRRLRWFAPLMLLTVVLSAQELRVATLNVWSGLTYEGVWSIGTTEDPARHEQRMRDLIAALREDPPDILGLQEVNPAGGLSKRIADSLGYAVISQRILGGIKVGPVGLPWNLNEGLAILARPDLDLEQVDVIPLNPAFGGFGDVLSFHFAEQNAALIGSVHTTTGRRVLIVNTHLPAYLPDTEEVRAALADVCRERGMTGEETDAWRKTLKDQDLERTRMIDRLVTILDRRFPGIPLVLLGDFNLPPDAPGLAALKEDSGYTDASSAAPGSPGPTWYGTTASASPGETPLEELSRRMDRRETTLDYVFVRHPLSTADVRTVSRIVHTQSAGLHLSDHAGLMVSVDIPPPHPGEARPARSVEWLPMMSYDTDVGFGYGAKVFVLGRLGMQESFDAIVFNSTRGEQWYRLVFSVPDFELRQGTVYPASVDITLDYDKYLKNVFYGIGPNTVSAAREEYTREPFEAQLLVSRGLTRQTVMQAGLRYRWIRNSNIQPGSSLFLAGPLSTGTATAVSLQAIARHDTRNSYINPSRGAVLQAEIEYAPSIGDVALYQGGLTLQYYTTIMYPKTVLAVRVAGRSLGGTGIPVQFLLPLGGNKTLRGYPQDRFLGRTVCVTNAELRFPLFWRFGAIAGVDAGNIWLAPGDVSFSVWKSNGVLGLRFYMDTFIVRADLGFSRETTGFYLNFGHVF